MFYQTIHTGLFAPMLSNKSFYIYVKLATIYSIFPRETGTSSTIILNVLMLNYSPNISFILMHVYFHQQPLSHSLKKKTLILHLWKHSIVWILLTLYHGFFDLTKIHLNICFSFIVTSPSRVEGRVKRSVSWEEVTEARILKSLSACFQEYGISLERSFK